MNLAVQNDAPKKKLLGSLGELPGEWMLCNCHSCIIGHFSLGIPSCKSTIWGRFTTGVWPQIRRSILLIGAHGGQMANSVFARRGAGGAAFWAAYGSQLVSGCVVWHVLSCWVVAGWCWLLLHFWLLLVAGLLVVYSAMMCLQLNLRNEPLGFTEMPAGQA